MHMIQSPAAYLRSIGFQPRLAGDELKCTECNGRGYFESDNGPAPREDDCEDCGGTGVRERTDFESMGKVELGQSYADLIGYDPFEDDPETDVEEIRKTLRDYETERYS